MATGVPTHSVDSVGANARRQEREGEATRRALIVLNYSAIARRCFGATCHRSVP
jgi:hypothetical protein